MVVRVNIAACYWICCLVWILALGTAISGSLWLSLSTWRRYQDNPTVVSMEHNYKDWSTSFPAITLCPILKSGEANVQHLLDNELAHISDKEGLRYFMIQLANANYSTFGEIEDFPALLPEEYLKVVKKMRFQLKFNVSHSNFEMYNNLLLTQTMTEMGICYTYNSIISHYNDIKYWESGNWSRSLNLPVFSVSPLDGDIFAQVMNLNLGYTVYIHGPTETPDAASKSLYSFYNSYKTLDIEALSIYSTEEIRSLSISQRKCRFLEESDYFISPIYSYNLCRIQCRLKLSKQLCGCVPYFYRPLAGYSVCDVIGMKCLAKYEDVLIQLRYQNMQNKKVNCPCYPPCNDVNYVVENDNTISWTLGTTLKWSLVKYPRLRLKRDILFGFIDLLVSIGGTAGLFLGCSFLSFVEIFYFFTLRLFWIIRKGHY